MSAAIPGAQRRGAGGTLIDGLGERNGPGLPAGFNARSTAIPSKIRAGRGEYPLIAIKLR